MDFSTSSKIASTFLNGQRAVHTPSMVRILLLAQVLVSLQRQQLRSMGRERQVSMRLRGESTSTVAIPYLCYVDANNNIRAEIDYGAQTLKVQRINGGVVTQIGSTVTLSTLYPTDTWGTDYEYRDVFRFALIETNSGADLLIRVYYGGSLVYEQTYASNPFTVGKIALASTGAKTYTDLIEVLLLPTTQDRVGPNP